MMIKASTRYQFRSSTLGLLMHYGIYVSVLLIIGFLVRNATNMGNLMSSNGFEISPMIYFFVQGLNSFREPFNVSLQNGISRRTQFLSSRLVLLAITLAAVCIDRLSISLLNLVPNMTVSSLAGALYGRALLPLSPFVQILTESLVILTLYWFISSLGLLITTAYYRMNALTKVLVSTLVPFTFFVAIKLFGIHILRFLDSIFGLSRQLPILGALTLALLSALFSGGAWLLMRRATIK